jgi:hypothetical protein
MHLAPPIRPLFFRGVYRAVLLMTAAALVAGCARVQPIPRFDLHQPGWQVRQGQAIWRPSARAPELATELLIAWRPDESAFVQLTKTPFPIIMARRTSSQWEAEFEQRRFAGAGTPPARVVWLHLPSFIFEGTPLPKPWEGSFEDGNLRVKNRATGEFLEGWLDP